MKVGESCNRAAYNVAVRKMAKDYHDYWLTGGILPRYMFLSGLMRYGVSQEQAKKDLDREILLCSHKLNN